MIEMMAHWLREAGVDGFRCDVAGLVPTDFWEEARPALEAIRPDLFLLAEWSTPDLMAKAFDADYAWPFHAALNRVLSLGAPASEIRSTWEEERRNFPKGSHHLRFSDNHDEKRAIARFGEPAALAAQALVFTMDGIPLVYNGMEIGDTAESGGPALTERVPLFWPIVARRPEFAQFYREMIALRRRHEALRRGETLWVPVVRPGPRRVLRPARRRRGRARGRQPVEPAVDRHRGAARRARLRRDHARRAPAPAARRRHPGPPGPQAASCRPSPSTPGASASSSAERSRRLTCARSMEAAWALRSERMRCRVDKRARRRPTPPAGASGQQWACDR